jgi:hypothetical protein
MTELLSSIEAVVTHAEETWDALEGSEIATVIPVAGHLVKLWRVGHDVRDAMLRQSCAPSSLIRAFRRLRRGNACDSGLSLKMPRKPARPYSS